jgi:nicotinamide-nucleotide amidase
MSENVMNESAISKKIEDSVVRLSEKLLATGGWLATAESCTGGMVAAAATAVAGSSRWFDQGWVTYSNEAKQRQLGVANETLLEFGAVSEQVAVQMAEGVLKMAPRANLSVVTTGIAGPGGGTTIKPVGLVWFGVAKRSPEGMLNSLTRSRIFPGDRQQVRQAAVHFAIEMALELLG